MSYETLKLTIDATFTVRQCTECRVRYAIEEGHEQRLRRTHETFYCPAGHPQYFPGESDIERAQKATARAQELLSQERRRAEQIAAELESAKKSAGLLKKRCAAGVCACCHRSFRNVRRHMRTKHPEFVAAK